MEQKRLIWQKLAGFLLFAAVLCSGTVASAKEREVIRVGYSNSEFLYAGSKNAYAGYGYELLQMIARYEPVKYQYVYANSKKLHQMLEDGEIDLLAPVSKTKELQETFDFTDLSIGSSQMVICAKENSDLAEHLYTKKLVIGMIDGTSADREVFQKYCKKNNIDARLATYSVYSVLKDDVKSNAVDAVFARRWDVNNYQILARFGAEDMYFAVKKGNDHLLQYLNDALEMMAADSPEYQKTLYEKYYARHDITGTVLSSKEKKFIKSLDSVIVAVPGNMAPLQQENDQGGFSGIHISVLDAISQKTGIMFEYINTGTVNQAVACVKEGKADIICGIVDNSSWADTQELLLTSSYMENMLALVKQKDHEASTGKSVLAEYNQTIMLSKYYNSSILECSSLEECFSAIKENKADFTFGNVYAVDYLKAKALYRDFEVSAISESGGRYCFAMKNRSNLKLYRIMNKAVQAITSEMVEEAVVNAVMERETEFSLLGYIYDHTIGVIVVILAASALVVLIFLHVLRKNAVTEKTVQDNYDLLDQKYHVLMDMVEDCLFEYDMETDIITCSDSFMKAFGTHKEYKNFRKFHKFEEKIHPDDISLYKDFLNAMLKKDFSARQIQIRLFGKGQEYHTFYVYACLVQREKGKKKYVLGRVFDENTKRMNQTKGEEFQGLYSYFETKDLIVHTLEQSESREKHVMVLVNIYHKEQKGQQEEKELLIRAAECMKTCVRVTDVVGYSGDKQLLLFMTRIQSREQIDEKLDKIRYLLHKEFYSDDVGMTIGYSVYPLQGGNYEELYEKAMFDMSELSS